MTFRKFIPVVVFALVAAACSSDDSAESDAAGDTVAEESAEASTSAETSAPAETVDTTPTSESSEPEAGSDAAAEGESDAAGTVTIEASPHITIAAGVTVESPDATVAEVTATADGHEVVVPRTAEAATDYMIPLVGMRAETDYDVNVELFDAAGASQGVVAGGTFTTGSLPSYFGEHELTIDADRAAPGYTIVEFDALRLREDAPSSQHLVAYDNDGEIVWYYTNTGTLAAVEPTPAGTFTVLYWPFGIREVDLLGNVVGNWRPQPRGVDADEVDDEFVVEAPNDDQVAFTGGAAALEGNPGDAAPIPITNDWIDLVTLHHEGWPMPNGNILTLSTTSHDLTPEQRRAFCPDDPNEFNAVSDVAVEFTPEGKVVRTWDLWDAVDIDEHPGGEMCVTTGIFAEGGLRDWTHANSVTYDPERDVIIVSSRHTNQIIAFDHLDEEGPQSSVRWIIGAGTPIAEGGNVLPLDGEPTYYQHAVEVNADGSLVVYDNGNARPGIDPENPAYSRAVIYEVDDASEDRNEWSATQRWEHIDYEDNGDLAYSDFISDADVLENGNVLVTHGGIGAFPPDPEDPLHILIREVVPAGESGGDIVWELQSADGFVTYRSERIPTFYFGPQFVS